MGVAVKLRWKRIINQLRYLYEECDLVESISTDCAPEFQLYYEEFCERNDIDLNDLSSQNAARVEELFGKPPPAAEEEELSEDVGEESLVLRDKTKPEIHEDPEYKMSQEEQVIHDSFRKVFLKLALILHPDKIDPSLSEEAQKISAAKFQKIKDAFEERRYFVLLDHAEHYNIAVPKNYKQQIKWMKKEIFQIEGKIEKEKITYNYAFAECDTDQERDQLIQRFMAQVFGPIFTEKG